MSDSSTPRWWLWAILGVFTLALGLRLGYIAEIRDIGFFQVPLSDAKVYVDRAKGIAAGDWLGPAEYIHAPLYPYLLAPMYMAGVDSLLYPRLGQAVLGGLTCVLVMLATRRLFRPMGHAHAGALAAGVLMAIYPPAIFLDGLIQKASVILVLSAAVLWLMLAAAQEQRRWLWFACAVAMGLLILVRQNALAVTPLLVAWAWLGQHDAPLRLRAHSIAAIALGLAVTLTPWALRHKVVIGDFVLTTPNMGQNFAMGNHPAATGTYLPAQRGRASGDTETAVWYRDAEEALGRSLAPEEVSDFYMDASLEYIRDNPPPWLGLTAKKWLMTWGAYELPDTEDYYLYKDHSRIVRWGDAAFHFGVIGPLAIVGVVLTAGHWRRLWPMYLWLLAHALAIAAFVVFARYRAPMLPAVMMFAGIGIVQGTSLVAGRSWRKLGWPLAVALVAAAVINWPVHSRRVPHAFSYVNHAVALADGGEYDRALQALDRAEAIDPAHIDAKWIRGSVLFDMHQYEQAAEQYRAAIEGDPGFGGGYRGLGSCLLQLQRPAEAALELQRALELYPKDALAMNKLALANVAMGQIHEARRLLETAAAIAPDDPEVQLNLGNVFVGLGRIDAAVQAYRQALMLRPNYPDAALNLASVHINSGRLDAAIEQVQPLLEQNPPHFQAQLMHINALIRAGRQDEALDAARRYAAQSHLEQSQRASLQQITDALREQ